MKKFATIATVFILTLALCLPVAAYIRGYNYDDFVKNPGADLGDNKDSPNELYNGKSIEGYERDDDGATNFTTLSFEVPAAGTYAFWFLVWAENETSNSQFLSLDGGEIFTFDYYESPEPDPDFVHYNKWYWMWMNSRQEIMDENPELGFDGFNAFLSGQKKHFTLTEGAHTLKIITREPYARYNGVIITDDLNYDPNNDAALQIGKNDPAAVYGPPPPPTEAPTEPEPVAVPEPAAPAPEPAPAAPQAPAAPATGDFGIFALVILAAAVATCAVFSKKLKAK